MDLDYHYYRFKKKFKLIQKLISYFIYINQCIINLYLYLTILNQFIFFNYHNESIY